MALCAAFTLNIFVCPHIFRAVVYLYLSLSPSLHNSLAQFFYTKRLARVLGEARMMQAWMLRRAFSAAVDLFLVLKP